MEIELISKEGDKARIRAVFAAKEVTEEFEKALRAAGRRVKVPGFRPGKAPRGLILKRISAGELMENVRNALRQRAVEHALKNLQLEIRALRAEFVDDKPPEEEKDFEFTFEIPLMPKVVLPDYRSFRLPLKKVTITREMKEEYKKRLRERFAKLTDKNSEVKLGDAIVYSFKTYFADTGEETPLSAENVTYITGKEDNLPNYDDNFIGKKAGDSIEFEYVMPEDFVDEKVAGKKLLFRGKISAVQEVFTPELDLAFIQEHFKMTDMREFEKYLEDTLAGELEQEEQRYKQRLSFEQVVARTEAHLSEEIIKEEVDFLVSKEDKRLRASGTTLEEALRRENKSQEEFRRELRELAITRIKQYLVVREIAKKEGIQVEKEDISRHTASVARRYGLNRQQVERLLRSRDYLNDASANILHEKVMKHLAQSVSFYYEGEERSETNELGP